jgi:triacylglycerol lipase
MRAGRDLVAAALIAAALVAGGVVGATVPGVEAAPAAPTAPVQAEPRDPVVVIPGTLAGEPLVEVDIQALADALRSEGYGVYIYWLPGNGVGDMRETAAGLPAFVDDVLAWTGADAVDLVGHSQGGLLARYYVRFLGGDGVVDSLVSLGAPHYGTQLANLASLFGSWNCLGVGVCTQAAVGSAFLADLNAGDDTPGGARYTTFTTRFDEIVLPSTNALLRGDGNVNVIIQQQCPLRVVEHLALPNDVAVQGGVVDALEGRPVTLDCTALL